MFKNQKASFYLALAASVCALVSLVLFLVSNATVGYGILNSRVAILCTAAGVILGVFSAFLQKKGVNEIAITVSRILALLLVMVALGILLMDRAVVAGDLFTWNGLDTYAWHAFYTGIACLVFQLLGALLFIVSGCVKQ